MSISTNDKVNKLLSDIQFKSQDQFDIVLAIREQFFKSNNHLTEDVKYGGIVFNASNALLGGIYVYKQHISIEFSNGADFIDSESTLEGSGKRRRHLKIDTAEDLVKKNSQYFIDQAV